MNKSIENLRKFIKSLPESPEKNQVCYDLADLIDVMDVMENNCNILYALLEVGVDKWEGYSEALKIVRGSGRK